MLGGMKTTFDLPEEIIREIKLQAVLQRRTAKSLVADLLREGLGMTPRDAKLRPPLGEGLEIDEVGLPVIRCNPGAPASRMSVPQSLELEQQILAAEDKQRAGINRVVPNQPSAGIQSPFP